MTPSLTVTFDELTARIAARLAELEPLADEYAELLPVAERLGITSNGRAPVSVQPKPKPTRTKAEGPPKTRRGRSGTRKDDVLRLARKYPGSTVPEIAKRLGIGDTSLYRRVSELVAEGQLRKDGARVYPVTGEPEPAPDAGSVVELLG